MKQFTGLIGLLSRWLNRIASACFVAVMVLVVANIILRTLFKAPILGTYEYVNLLTAIAIAMALAYCAFQDGHIAVGVVVDRLPCKWQAVIDVATNITALVFWSMAAWYLGKEAGMMTANGMVAATTSIPLSPVIYLLACGLAGLCLVLALRLSEALRKAVQ